MWNQLKDATKKADMGMQKCQKLFMAARSAILEASRGACGTIKANLVQALVLILSGNRGLNLKRRELLRRDLNAQFSALCNLFILLHLRSCLAMMWGKTLMKWRRQTGCAEKLAAHKKGCVARYKPYVPKRRSIEGHSQNRLDDSGHSKSQAFLVSAEQRSLQTDCEARNSAQGNPGITPPQVRYDIDIRNIVDSQGPFVAG